MSPVSSTTAVITTGSVLGCEKLCSPVAVAQGFFPVFSAQGRRVEHVSFHPAQDEWTGLPHEAQNWSRGRAREGDHCVSPEHISDGGSSRVGRRTRTAKETRTLFRAFQSTIVRASAKTAASKTSRDPIAARGSVKRISVPWASRTETLSRRT